MNLTADQFNKTEKVKLIKDVRIKVKGEDTARLFSAGKVVEVSGRDKIQLLGSGAGQVLSEEAKEVKK